MYNCTRNKAAAIYGQDDFLVVKETTFFQSNKSIASRLALVVARIPKSITHARSKRTGELLIECANDSSTLTPATITTTVDDSNTGIGTCAVTTTTTTTGIYTLLDRM